MELSLSLLLIEQNVNHREQTDGKTVGQTQKSIPVIGKLKDPHIFPHQKQYPLKSKAKEGLNPVTENLKEESLLVSCSSSCNTSILGVKKLNDKYKLVQDLQIINEAIVPLQPFVPNPYTTLSEIP